MDDRRRFPNLFWPVILIGVGGLYLLQNLGMIEMISFYEIWRLWPIFLVIAGINMLFGKRNRWLASLLSGLMALVVVAFLFFAPMVIDTLPTPEMTTERFADPLGDARQADVVVDFDRGNVEIFPLVDNPNLFTAVVTHDEKVTFNSSGSSSRNIRLHLDQVGPSVFTDWISQNQVQAEVGLATGVPVDLEVYLGGGNSDMALSEIMLDNLKADSGSGNLTVSLPGGNYPVDLSSGSGSVTVATSEDSQLDMKVDVGSGRIAVTLADGNSGEIKLESGSGSITVVVPEGLAVQVRGDTGSGSVSVPAGFVRTSGGENVVGDGGTWQTEGFDQAELQLVIRFDVGSGSFKVLMGN